MNLHSNQPHGNAARSVPLSALDSARPTLVLLLGAAINLLYVLIRNLLSLI